MILLIDSYDSFTNNLVDLIEKTTGDSVVVIHNDSIPPSRYAEFAATSLKQFKFVVIGPGPGHPANDSDAGIIKWLLQHYRTSNEALPPVLGICLGFQAICAAFGCDVRELGKVRHGQVYPLEIQSGSKLFASVDGSQPVEVVRYHSLYVPELVDELEALAHCVDEGEKVLMAVRHREMPLYGVQYHPESVCSTRGSDLIKDFAQLAGEWSPEPAAEELSRMSVHFDPLVKGGFNQGGECSVWRAEVDAKVGPVDVCDHLKKEGTDFLLLNSASQPGEWSIVGLPMAGESELVTHSVDSGEYVVGTWGKEGGETHKGSAWEYWGKQMAERYIPRSQFGGEAPFEGGYLGLIAYEEGQHIVLPRLPKITDGVCPDMKLVFVERFLLLDHRTHRWYVRSNRADDELWVTEMRANLTSVKPIDLATVPMIVEDLGDSTINYELPDFATYKSQFETCQRHLHSGDSYELCLTTASKITVPRSVDPWDIYKVLALRKNPSPYSCYFEFEDVVLISSSPERFLSWKETKGGKVAQLRPIKGTVKNTPDISYEDAVRMLRTPKEMGENLMIVDLIRHDLFQFLDNVQVPQLMTVEEYKTVYQLVSVISGDLPRGSRYTGVDVLRQSLPPGSMTGAPKKRSIELLQEIEAQQPGYGRRGVYSGVVGYWSVTDDSDWSVVIRSAFHYRDDLANTQETSLWRIGAGGAITVLSDLMGEWEEMRIKLTSALQAFTNNV
ncbi:aminodeoxychorismate synthase [Diutina catenulata]